MDCFAVCCFNVGVIVTRKVYKSWSTFSIMVSCCLLLVFRGMCLTFYALYDDYSLPPKLFLMVLSLMDDVPCFLVFNLTLALIWQWWRIANLLEDPDKVIDAAEDEEVREKASNKRLYCGQICLLVGMTVDFLLLVAHYGFGAMTAHEVIYDDYTIK